MKKLTVNKGWMVGIEYQRRIAGIVSRRPKINVFVLAFGVAK